MCGILTAEIDKIIEPVTGADFLGLMVILFCNYVAKVGLPCILPGMVAIAVSLKGLIAGLAGLIGWLSMVILSAAERITFHSSLVEGCLRGLVRNSG